MKSGSPRPTASAAFPPPRRFPVSPGETAEAELVFEPLWDARAHGYRSADHHFHLNYGGVTRLSPDDLELMIAG